MTPDIIASSVDGLPIDGLPEIGRVTGQTRLWPNGDISLAAARSVVEDFDRTRAEAAALGSPIEIDEENIRVITYPARDDQGIVGWHWDGQPTD